MQWLKLANSNLVHSLGLPKPIKNHIQKKSGRDVGQKELPKFEGCPLPFDAYAMAETSDFKFSIHSGFAKAHHKNHTQKKVGVALKFGVRF